MATYFANSNGYPGQSAEPRKGIFTAALLTVRECLTSVREFPALDANGFIGDSLNSYKIIMAFELDPESLRRPVSAAAASMEQPEYEAEWERSDEDAFLVHAILLRELNEIRAEVRSLWKKFARGHLSLTSVTMATNVAIQLAGLMESEMMAVLPTFRFTSSHHHAFEKARIAAEMALPFNKDATREQKMEILYRIKDYCLMQTQGRFSASNAPTDPVSMVKEDCATLLEVFGGISFILSTDDWVNEEFDELTSAFIQLWQFSEHAHPFSASLAGSIYLDIIKLLRKFEMLQKPADCLVAFRRTLLESVFSAEVYASALLCGKQLMYRLMHGIEFIKAHSQVWDKENPFKEALVKEGISEDILKERHPLFVGTWIHRTRMVLCDVGSNCAIDTGALGFAARLYRSLCRDKLLSPGVWLDLDMAIALRSSGAFLITRTKPAIFERAGTKATEETEDANDGNVPPESSERKSGQQKATGDGPSHVSKSKDDQKQGQESGQKEETDQTATNNQHDRDPQATPTAQYQDSEKPTRIGYLSRLFGPKCIFGVNGPHGPVPDELVWAISRRGRYAMNLVDRDTQAIVKGQETDQSGGVSQARNIKDILAMDAALDPCTVSFLITHLAYGLHDELPETSFDYLALDVSALEVIRKIADRQPSQHNVQLVDELAECLGRLALNGPSREVISAFLGKKAESPKQCIDGTEDGSGPLESGTDMNLPKLAAEEILRWTKNEPRPCCIASKRLGELGTVICMDHCCSSGWAAQIKTPNVTVVQKHDEEIPQASKIEEHPNGKEEGNEEICAKVSGGQPSSK
ncbi:hypothetical protein MCOR23_003717 [Pyricularia oryzae]|nr:hypothetical protein MCOR01_006681 [Pyricularia oryzae]KAI6371437.1 hypothetical protein MCOR32_006213 [Pyricularia oryzae]KAI6402815.1 hypothetical protein MCOR23_003717 [Pyricularia oryzae]KAI6413678.1 hypothetical protein MCOR20_002707 [Pyricularia oryzae]KAI6419092.1 hypothetical protein MCOR24_005154 [Pyricularia oryzae]